MEKKKRKTARGGAGATLPAVFVEKLASSGLTPEDADRLGMVYLRPDQVKALHPSFLLADGLLINYYDLDGQPLRVRPQHPAFFRLRYLTEAKDFQAQTRAKKARYVQPPDTGVGAYLPRLVDWRAIAADPDLPLIITEGELKAAKATKEGFPTIGLGGVWNFKSARGGVAFLPELEQLVWLRRNVYICYDSDFREKEGVVMALNELAGELMDRGAYPHVVTLPELSADEGGKTGLDDFLVHPAGGPEQLRHLLHKAQPLTLARPLWALNEQVVYVRNPGLIVEQRTGNKISPTAFKEHAYATAKYMEQEFRSDGTVSLKKVPAAPAWLRWNHRREVEQLTYRPGHGRFCEDEETGAPSYNTWRGWGVEPEPGDTGPWHELLRHLFASAEPEALEWFLDWCAYPLQYPGTKLFSAVVVHGIHEGTGKSLIGYTLGKIYGDNFAEIRQEDIHNGRNDWAENKQFVMGDEITGSDKRQDADVLKRLITQKKIRIDIKYVPAYSLPDRINYYFTSNQPDSFFITDKDRRYLVIEVTLPPLPQDFYVEYDLWLHGRGPSHLFHELLSRDLGDFNPAAPAFVTQAKRRMVDDTRSDLASWVRWLMESPDQVLSVGRIRLERDLVTNKDLLRLYDPDGSKRVTANGLGRELRRAGLPLANKGLPVKTSLGVDRLYIVRNHKRWEQAGVDELRHHVDTAERAEVKRKL